MLNRNLKWAICLLIVLFSGVLSFADELPPVTIKASYGSEFTISTIAEARSEWDTHEDRLNTANDDMEELKDDLADIEAEIKEKEKAGKVAKGVVTLVAGKQLRASAGVIPIINWTGGSAMYDLVLQRIDKYAEIDRQNTKISNAFSDRETFYFEYVRRWEHHNSPSNPAPPRVDQTALKDMLVAIPMLSASCKNACGVFYYDSFWYDFFSSYEGGIGKPLSLLSDAA